MQIVLPKPYTIQTRRQVKSPELSLNLDKARLPVEILKKLYKKTVLYHFVKVVTAEVE